MNKEISITIKISTKTISLLLVIFALLGFYFANSYETYAQSFKNLFITKTNNLHDGGKIILEHPKLPNHNVILDVYVDANNKTFFRIHSNGSVQWQKEIKPMKRMH